MNDHPRRPHPIAAAVEWVAKITTVAFVMFLPAVGGRYLDQRFGTNYWALGGLILGLVAGMWHLLRITQPKGPGRPPTNSGNTERGSAARRGE